MGGTLTALGAEWQAWLLAAGAGTERIELAPPGYGWALLKLLGALLLVCVLAYGVLLFLRRQLQAARPGAGLRVVERLPLSNRQSLFLVEAAGRYFLIGAGEAGAPARLAELEPEAVQRVVSEGRPGGRRSFWQILHRGDAPSRPPGEV